MKLRLLVLLVIAGMQSEAPCAPDGQLHTLRPDLDVDELGVLQSYQEAVELEQEIAQMYREIRAARLSQIQRQHLGKSLRQTLLPISSRMIPDGAVLNSTAQNGDDIAAYQGELKKVMQENDAIVANAEEMLLSLLPEPVAEDVEETEEALEEADQEVDEAEKSLEQLEAAQEQMAAAAAAMAAKLTQAMSAAAAAKDQEIAQQQIMERLAQAESGTYLDVTKQMKGQDLTIKSQPVPPSEYPPPISKTFTGIAGRKLVREGGTPAVWFHVNKWYIMGPYDNAGRMNLQRVYPPQSIIDLDAHYLGKHGATLAWAYDSFAQEMVVPSTGRGDYTIFYGYTELFFEEASDVWIAVGSDDRSDVWINDMPVWHSSNQLKIWRIDEGFRKVHFQQGRNKVVFRLENGWQSLGFSLLVNASSSE